jgi:hypothetical protein
VSEPQPPGPQLPKSWRTSLSHLPRRTSPAKNRSLRLDPDVKSRAASKAEADRLDFADVVKVGWAQFMAGQIEPQKPIRRPARTRVEGEELEQNLASTSVRATDEEWTPLLEWCKAESARRGWRVNPSRLATQYLRDEFLKDAPPAQE